MAEDILAILKMQTARETAHRTNKVSLIRTRARTACLTSPSLQTRWWDRRSNKSAEVFLYNVKKRVKRLDGLSYLDDSVRIRAPCTNNAQVKFTTKKNILRLRKNSLRGSLQRQMGDSCLRIRSIILDYLILDRNRLFLCFHGQSAFKALENSRPEEKSRKSNKKVPLTCI